MLLFCKSLEIFCERILDGNWRELGEIGSC